MSESSFAMGWDGDKTYSFGNWKGVKLEDYKKLEAENKRLREAIEDMVKATSSDKIERLREALEKLSNYLHGNCPECGDYKAEEMQELAKQALEETQ